jgi:putative PEP-CTERM system TPR-repeat lipoprotein
LLLAMLVAGCSSGEKPEQYLAKAQQYYAAGNQNAAVIELKNAIQKNPDYPEARSLLGKIYLEQNDGPSAEKELRRALRLGAAKDVVVPQLARALLLQRDYKNVLEEIPAKPDGKPAQVATLLALRGDAYAGLNQPADAQAAYEEARRLEPGLPEANRGLAALALAQNRMDRALQLADESIKTSGDQADPWVLKGDLLRAQGKNAEAIQAYQEALKRKPNHLGVHLSLAQLYMGQKQLDASQTEIEAARKIEPHAPAVRLAQGQLYFQQQKFSQARDELQEVLKVAPNNGMAILMMGATQLALGSYAQAETYLSAFVKAVPNHAYARRLLAATYLKSKQPAKAEETLRPLLTADTQDAAVLALAGDTYMQLKDYAKATEYLEKAVKANPASAGVRTELAMSHLAAGDVARGTSELEAAADMEGSPLQTDVALIVTYMSKGDFDKALKAIDALEKKQPNNPLVFNLRGGAYVGKQDMANARKAFEKALAIDPAYYPAAANLAQLDLREKNPQAARKRFDGVLAANKNSVPAMVAIAALERNTGNEKSFVSWLEKASRTDAKALQPRALLVQYYLGRKEAQRALAIAREAQTANPSSPEALGLLGNAQLAAGEKDNAVATFDKLVLLAPQAPGAYLRLAAAQVANKDPGAARESLNKALALKPGLIDAQVGLIDLDLQANRPDDAIKRAIAMQQQQPKSPVGYAVLGNVYVQQKDFVKAAEQYQKAFDLAPNGPSLARLYDALVRSGKSAEADSRVSLWLKEHPDDYGVRSAVAESKMAVGDYAAATVHYLYLNQKLPGQVPILNNLAYAFAEQKDRRAVDYAEQAYKLQPDSPAVLDTYGWALTQTGQAAKGLGFLQQALSRAPDAGDMQYHYAAALAMSGDKKRAQQELQQLLNSGVEFSQRPQAVALMKSLQAR